MAKKKILPLKACLQCWESFEPNNTTLQKFCSDNCRLVYKREQQRERTKQSLIDGSGHAYLRLRFEVFRRDGFACQYCGRTAKEDIKLHIDHILPKSKGGSLSMDNLITACYECNEGKRDVVLTEREIVKLKRP